MTNSQLSNTSTASSSASTAPATLVANPAAPTDAGARFSLGDVANWRAAKLVRRLVPVVAVAMLFLAMGGSWGRSAVAAPSAPATQVAATTGSKAAPAKPDDGGDEPTAKKSNRKQVSGKVNLNTASEEQLMMLPTVGPSKAERIVEWRKKNGGFKRTADLRHVKGFGYKTFKKLEPYLDIKGDTTIAVN